MSRKRDQGLKSSVRRRPMEKQFTCAILMDLCYMKNAELANYLQKCKGRAVLGGETTSKSKKDTEQRLQSEVLQCLRWQRQSSWTRSQSFLVWLEKQVTQFPRYTQDKMTEAPRLLRMPKEKCPEMWIIVPSRQRPKGWNNIEDTVILLERNINCHPVAPFGKEKLKK